MKQCTCCLAEKEIANFSPQKTNPKKLYAWCDKCRSEHTKPVRASYRDEIRLMRSKAKQLRKFDDTQAAELHRLYKVDKVPVKELAEKYGASTATIYKTIGRVK